MDKVVGIIFLALVVGFIVYAAVRVIRLWKGQDLDTGKRNISDENRVEVTAIMTGRTNLIDKVSRFGRRINYKEYEISYTVDGKTYNKWFNLSPAPDLADEVIEGREILIAYDKKKPSDFEVIKIK